MIYCVICKQAPQHQVSGYTRKAYYYCKGIEDADFDHEIYGPVASTKDEAEKQWDTLMLNLAKKIRSVTTVAAQGDILPCLICGKFPECESDGGVVFDEKGFYMCETNNDSPTHYICSPEGTFTWNHAESNWNGLMREISKNARTIFSQYPEILQPLDI